MSQLMNAQDKYAADYARAQGLSPAYGNRKRSLIAARTRFETALASLGFTAHNIDVAFADALDVAKANYRLGAY